jgi:hypothetical protein
MVNYQLGKIYTVRSLTSPEIYVGSTTAPLCKRMSKHRNSWKMGLVLGKNKNIVIDINEWYIELYENYPCDKVEELTAREGVIIREIGTLNKRIEGRTPKEYRIENADKIKETKKQYYLENVDTIKEKDKQYRIENVDKIQKFRKQYYIENADNIKEYQKEYRIENADNIKEKYKQYYNADNIKEQKKQYYLENVDKIKEKKKQYNLKRKLAKSQITIE